MREKKPAQTKEQKYYAASQWRLIWRKFIRFKPAIVGLVLLVILYTMTIFAPFFAPYLPAETYTKTLECAPRRVRIIDPDTGKLTAPFVCGLTAKNDPVTYRKTYEEDLARRYPIRFFVRGAPYKLFGFISSDIHFFGTDDPAAPFYLLGSDKLGRDLFSRILYGGQTSLSIGLIGVLISFVLGCLIGGLSGYFGGMVDTAIQRVIEFLTSLPTIPIWMALAAALPPNWPSTYTYFGITVLLSLLGWTGIARVVRGKFMVMKNDDYVTAARLMGASDFYIIVKHLIPGFMSYLIVQLTLAIPNMILGETSLSFLGLGIQPPALSWGTLMQDAQAIKTIAYAPWLLLPAAFVVITVLSFNFVGDGLRDAADPYKS